MNINRQQQILSLIKRTISTILQDLNHELFHAVVVTDVLLSNDGHECRVWVDAPDHLIAKLNGPYHREIQHAVMKHIVRKIIPKVVFLKDTGEIDRMEALLEQKDL